MTRTLVIIRTMFTKEVWYCNGCNSEEKIFREWIRGDWIYGKSMDEITKRLEEMRMMKMNESYLNSPSVSTDDILDVISYIFYIGLES